MPLFFQHTINEHTRLGIWKIEETEEYFSHNVPVARTVTHPHKRLQHLAGRFLLQYLFPDFPYHLIEIADTRKPYLPGEEYHFSISHCGDYAAALVSRTQRVGVDIEEPGEKVVRVMKKFLNEEELREIGHWQQAMGNGQQAIGNRQGATGNRQWTIGNGQRARGNTQVAHEINAANEGRQLPIANCLLPVLLWSAKEAVFKWYGLGQVDFREHILITSFHPASGHIGCHFSKTGQDLEVQAHFVDGLALCWVIQ